MCAQVLDSEGKVFVYRGPQSDAFEKNKAAAVAQARPRASITMRMIHIRMYNTL